jgi:hypothetical protein
MPAVLCAGPAARLAVDRALSHIFKSEELATVFATAFGAQVS